jgi:protein-disulfide isomerase
MFTDEGYKLINNVVKNEKTKSGELASFLKQAVDEKFMKQCLDSGKYDARLNGDVAIAGKLGVNGTPGFFVNNTKFAGAVSYTSGMENTVNGALK